MEFRKANGRPFTAVDREKYAIARELGLMDILLREGWGGLTAQQSGRVGGILGKRIRDKESEIGSLREVGRDL